VPTVTIRRARLPHSMIQKSILILFLLFATLGFSQDYKITYYDEFSGLSSKAINGIVQDKDGYLWVSTINGLNRFNGYDFEVFDEPVKDGAPLNQIHFVSLDDKNSIWLGHNNGSISQYLGNGSFANFSPKTTSLPGSIITMIHFDSQGNLWVGSGGHGLYLFNDDYKKGRHVTDLTHISDTYSDKDRFNYNTIYDAEDISLTEMLIATHHGLYLLNKKNFQLTYLKIDNFSLQNRSDLFGKILRDKKDSSNFWITSYAGGLIKYNIKNNSWKIFKYESKFSSTKNIITGIVEKDSDNFWIATADKGIGIFNKGSEGFHFLGTAELASTLFVDREQVVWGSTEKGLIKIAPNFDHFKFIKEPVTSSENGDKFYVGEMVYDSIEGAIFTAVTFGDGLHKTKKGIRKNYKFDKHFSNPFMIIKDLVLIKGVLHIVTRDYLFRYDKKKDKLIRLNNDSNDRSSPSFRNLILDRSGKFWISSYNKGIFLYDPVLEKWTNFTNQNSTLNTNTILHVEKDENDRLWLLTNEGITIFKEKIIEEYKVPNGNSLSKSPRGDMWVSSLEVGLLRWKNDGGIYSAVPDTIKEAGNEVVSVSALSNESIWYSTVSSLSKLNPSNNFIEHYTIIDGLGGYDIAGLIVQMVKDKVIVSGTQGGFYELQKRPEGIERKNDLAIGLNYFKVNDSARVTTRDINDTMKLNYNENNIAFDFSVLSYLEPKKNKHYYKLDGYDQAWHLAEKRIGSFTNLPPGPYTLRLKGEDYSGVSSERSISFQIIPPVWKRWWFIVIVIISILALGVFLLFNWVSNIRKKVLLKKAEEIKKKNEELIEQNTIIKAQGMRIENQIGKIEEGLRVRNRILAIVGHDLRGPISSLKSIVNLLSQGKMTSKEFMEISKDLNHETDAIYKMVESVFEWARIHQSEIKVIKKEIDLFRLIENVVKINLRITREKSIKIDYTELSHYPAVGDEETIQIILRNLLANAVKFSPSGSTVSIKSTKVGEYIKLDISDQGIGIPNEQIIQLLSTGENIAVREGTNGEVGSGLGLSICKDLVEMNNGKFIIQSNVDSGTTISFTLPAQ
jgi:signal transduction histidine kinase/ligand-binding sensor domain-containing protein